MLLSTPLRVRNVPKMDSPKARITRTTFHRVSIWRRSWIMTEWRNAVATSQGMSAAFSTGSQAQYPPHPSTTYDHLAPNMSPMVRQYHAHSIQRRARSTPASSTDPAARPAVTIANGTVIPTNPRYNVGG